MPAVSRPFGVLPVTGYIRQKDLIPYIVPWGATTLWRKVRSGEFPSPVKLSSRVTAWRAEHIRLWLDQRVMPVASTSPLTDLHASHCGDVAVGRELVVRDAEVSK